MTEDAKPITVLQLSDLHLFADPNQKLLGLKTSQTLDWVLKQVNDLSSSPDLIILTGDLSQDESKQAYLLLQEKFTSFNVPVYAIPGNHDNPELMTAILTEPPFCQDRAFDRGGWKFVLLDSSVSGKVHGFLSRESLEWLDTQLVQACSTPTLIALHHPPYPVQSQWLDDIGLQNRTELWQVLDRHSQVKLVICGHIHQDFSYVRQGVHYLSTPSTCVQFEPHRTTFAVDKADPGFRVFRLSPEGSFETWVERVQMKQNVDLAAQGY